MICPRCKNEKLDQNICPHCGLDEKTALIKSADSAHQDGKVELAITYYDRYLQLSYDPEINQKRASCLFMFAASHFGDSNFNKACEGLFRALNDDWSWQKGHQFLIDLFYKYGKLEILEKEYEQIASHDELKRKECERLIGTIRLLKKFKDNPPSASTALSDFDAGTTLKSFLPLSGIPFLLWGIYKAANLARSKDGNHTPLLIFICFVLGLAICVLILISMNRFKGKNKEKVKEIKINEAD